MHSNYYDIRDLRCQRRRTSKMSENKKLVLKKKIIKFKLNIFIS